MVNNENPEFIRKCFKAHTYSAGYNESDSGKSESDEELRSLKPPAIPYEYFKHRIVRIGDISNNENDSNSTNNISTLDKNTIEENSYMNESRINLGSANEIKIKDPQQCRSTHNKDNGYIKLPNEEKLMQHCTILNQPTLPTIASKDATTVVNENYTGFEETKYLYDNRKSLKNKDEDEIPCISCHIL